MVRRTDFKKIVRDMDIAKSKKGYIKEEFDKGLNQGLTKYEMQKKIKELRYKSGDSLKRVDVDKIEEELSKHYD